MVVNMEEKTIKTDDIQRILLEDNKEDELAFFMNKFNLDIDTVEEMPAFEEHLKPIFSTKKEE